MATKARGQSLTEGPAPGRHKEHRLRPSFRGGIDMRKVVLLLAALLVLDADRGSGYRRRDQNAGRKRQQPQPSGMGKDEHAVSAGRRGRTTPTGSRSPSAGPPTRYVSNRIFNDVQPEPVLGERRHPVGLRLGAVHGPHVRPAPGGGRRDRERSRSTRPTRSRLHEHLGSIPFTRTPAAPGNGHRQRRRGSRSTRSRATSTASASTAARHDRLEWLREGPVDGKLSNNGAKLLLHERLPAARR